jgi:MFS family permease
LLLGFFSTAAATALLYLARNLWLLTLSRFLQGLSASVIYSVGFALLADTVGPDDIGQWMGFVIFSLNTGIMISPSLGGILYDNFGYESLFFAVFSLIGLDVLLRLIMIEKKDRSTFRQPLVLSEDAACAEYGTFQPENSSVGPKKQNLSMPAGTVPAPSEPVANSKSSAGDPLLHSKQQAADSVDDLSHPIPLITLLKSPRILTDLYGAWVTVTVLVSFDAALAIFVEKQFDWGPTGGGLIFLAVTIPIFTAPLAGKLADICPSRKLTAFWFILTGVFISTLCLVTNTNIEPWIQKIILCTSLTFYGE